jgi:hypothetical protein
MPTANDTNDRRRRRRGTVMVGMAAGIGFLFATDIALASNWAVTLNGGSSGESQAGSVGTLTITATASPSPTNLLYPGVSGDVVLQIVNSGPTPVQITALSVPSTAVMAQGYSNSALTTASASSTCGVATSFVTWTGGGATGATVTLTQPLIVAANNSGSPLVVTLTNWATMGALAPAACEGLYFQMPSLTGVTASVDNATPTTGPVTDS